MTTAPTTLRALGCEARYRRLTVRTPDGLSIAVQDWAQAGSTGDVLLIHGFSQSHLSWLKQVSGPLAGEFHLVTFDLRGHGDSDKPVEPQFYREAERWAGEIEAVITGAGLVRPVLVAWSYGGRVALDYLTCRGDAEIGGVVFVNATSKSDPSVMGPAATILQSMVSNDLAADIEATTALLKSCTVQPLPPTELCYQLAFNMVVPPAVRANLAGRPADYEAALRSLSVPALVLHGSADPISLPAMAEYTRSMVPNARCIVYPDVGHMPFWEVPARFDQDLAEFLTSVRNGGS